MMESSAIAWGLLTANIGTTLYILFTLHKNHTHGQADLSQLKNHHHELTTSLDNLNTSIVQLLTKSGEQQQQTHSLQQKMDQLHNTTITQNKTNLLDQQQSLRNVMQDIRSQLTHTLQQQNQSTNSQIKDMQKTEKSLRYG